MRRILTSLAAVALVIGLALLLRAYGPDLQPERLKALLAGNPWAPLIFVAVHIAASMTNLPPRLILAWLAGIAFGLWLGIALSMVGAVAGAIACFALVRYLHRGVFSLEGRRGHAWLEMVKKRLEDSSWRGVALVRLMPIPGTPSNYALGLLPVSFADYVWGTLIGVLPSTVFAVDLGAAGKKTLDGSFSFLDLLEPTLIGLAAIAASLALPWLLRLVRKS